MISVGMFVMLGMLWLILFLFGVLDLDNRAYLNIVALIVDCILSGYLTLVSVSGSIVDTDQSTANTVLFSYQDVGMSWVFALMTVVTMIITAYLIYEAVMENREARIRAEEG